MNALQTHRAAIAAGLTLRLSSDGKHIIVKPLTRLTQDLAEAITTHRAAILDYLESGHLGALVPPDTKGISFERFRDQEIDSMIAQYRADLRAEAANDLAEESPATEQTRQQLKLTA